MRLVALAPGLLAFTLAASARSADSDVSAIPYVLTRLSDRVIVLTCLDVNVTAIAARSGLVVIDTNRSSGAMRRLRSVIETEFGREDFAYLVNTHGDADHSAGNLVFPSVPLVAHENYAEFVRHAKASTLRNQWRTRSRLGAARSRYPALDRGSAEAESLRTAISVLETIDGDLREVRVARVPAITFRDSLSLDLGDLTLELSFHGEAHTNHDIVIYVPEEKLLLTGDLICSPQNPCFSVHALTDVPRLVDGLEGLLRREAGLEIIVPGHGKPLARADLATFCRSLSERYGQVGVENSAARILGRTIQVEGIHAALERCPPPTPQNPGTLHWSESEMATLGVRLTRSGRVEEALQVLRLAVHVLPESSYLQACLGDACLENNDREAALNAYRRSLSLEPANRYAAEMLEALDDGK